jgi:hypothetical protein
MNARASNHSVVAALGMRLAQAAHSPRPVA